MMGGMVLDVKQVKPDELLGPLNDIEEKFAPKILTISGNEQFFHTGSRVSVIGTRHPSANGITNAEQIVEFLVKHNVVIVSGLAMGIDTIAHKTAIANKGKTIGVLGTPLDKFYPVENKRLQEDMAKSQLLVSQFSSGAPIQRQNFPMRNRTMALLSHASIIVEAGKSSGTQHQGWEALRLGRPLFIMRSLLNNESLGWPQKLLEYGAQPLDLDHLDIILENLPSEHRMVMQDAFDFST